MINTTNETQEEKHNQSDETTNVDILAHIVIKDVDDDVVLVNQRG